MKSNFSQVFSNGMVTSLSEISFVIRTQFLGMLTIEEF